MRRRATTTALCLAALPLFVAVACQDPTRMVLDVTTDVPCAQLKGVAITAGKLGATEGAEPSTVTRQCEQGRIGTLVITPKSDKEADIGVRVVAGVDAEVESCNAANGYKGCVVGRRVITFREHETLDLPIFLPLVCKDVHCDEHSTCVLTGQCVDLRTFDPLTGGCGPNGCIEVEGGADVVNIDGPRADTGSDSTAPDAPGADAAGDGASGPACPPLANCGGMKCCLTSKSGGVCRAACVTADGEGQLGCLSRADCAGTDYCCMTGSDTSCQATCAQTVCQMATAATDCPPATPACSLGIAGVPYFICGLF